MREQYDAVVAGAGILGLAHAYHLARRGLRVLVLERHPRAQGASVRNFGMIWPIGQPAGELYGLARRSRDLWLEVLAESGLWHERSGSLHLAYAEDEAQVLREFHIQTGEAEIPCALLSTAEIGMRFPAVRRDGLRCGLWSAVEVTVDPRQVIARLPAWLERAYGVEFAFGTPVLSYSDGVVRTAAGPVRADRLVLCTGADFLEVAPEAFRDAGLQLCKLQMMRSLPAGSGFRIGTMLAAGLTLAHYRSFQSCPTLPELARRLDAELPEYRRYGIHVMAAQHGGGEIVLGDSHEYGDQIEPFDKAEIDALILRYLATFLTIPKLRIGSRWHGVYAKHPREPYVAAHPAPGVLAVTGVGGAGMTLSFGLAERTVAEWLGES